MKHENTGPMPAKKKKTARAPRVSDADHAERLRQLGHLLPWMAASAIEGMHGTMTRTPKRLRNAPIRVSGHSVYALISGAITAENVAVRAGVSAEAVHRLAGEAIPSTYDVEDAGYFFSQERIAAGTELQDGAPHARSRLLHQRIPQSGMARVMRCMAPLSENLEACPAAFRFLTHPQCPDAVRVGAGMVAEMARQRPAALVYALLSAAKEVLPTLPGWRPANWFDKERQCMAEAQAMLWVGARAFTHICYQDYAVMPAMEAAAKELDNLRADALAATDILHRALVEREALYQREKEAALDTTVRSAALKDHLRMAMGGFGLPGVTVGKSTWVLQAALERLQEDLPAQPPMPEDPAVGAVLVGKMLALLEQSHELAERCLAKEAPGKDSVERHEAHLRAHTRWLYATLDAALYSVTVPGFLAKFLDIWEAARVGYRYCAGDTVGVQALEPLELTSRLYIGANGDAFPLVTLLFPKSRVSGEEVLPGGTPFPQTMCLRYTGAYQVGNRDQYMRVYHQRWLVGKDRALDDGGGLGAAQMHTVGATFPLPPASRFAGIGFVDRMEGDARKSVPLYEWLGQYLYFEVERAMRVDLFTHPAGVPNTPWAHGKGTRRPPKRVRKKLYKAAGLPYISHVPGRRDLVFDAIEAARLPYHAMVCLDEFTAILGGSGSRRAQTLYARETLSRVEDLRKATTLRPPPEAPGDLPWRRRAWSWRGDLRAALLVESTRHLLRRVASGRTVMLALDRAELGMDPYDFLVNLLLLTTGNAPVVETSDPRRPFGALYAQQTVGRMAAAGASVGVGFPHVPAGWEKPHRACVAWALLHAAAEQVARDAAAQAQAAGQEAKPAPE